MRIKVLGQKSLTTEVDHETTTKLIWGSQWLSIAGKQKEESRRIKKDSPSGATQSHWPFVDSCVVLLCYLTASFSSYAASWLHWEWITHITPNEAMGYVNSTLPRVCRSYKPFAVPHLIKLLFDQLNSGEARRQHQSVWGAGCCG
jgi:hypothetical protein